MGKGHILAPLERIENIEQNGGGSVSPSTTNVKDIAVPLLADGWVLNETDNTYTQTADVRGLTDTSNPIILLNSANEVASEDELKSYKCITEATINEGSITFVADEKPSIGITLLEFVAGCIINLWCGLNVWDYSELPLNICGQICILFTGYWCLLSVIAIIADDWLRYLMFDEEKPHYKLF